MTEVLTHALAFGAGAGALWLVLRPRLAELTRRADELRRLTDRDERGRYVRREP